MERREVIERWGEGGRDGERREELGEKGGKMEREGRDENKGERSVERWREKGKI
jgi:hypothetical protein